MRCYCNGLLSVIFEKVAKGAKAVTRYRCNRCKREYEWKELEQ